jgi:protein-disulfide isomerase
VPPVGPEDHVRGEGPEAIVYVDLACPRCALAWSRVRDLPLRLVLRHFPIATKHPRAPALHAAAEAAGLQGHFAEMWDSLLVDQGHQDDPHLWERVERIGLDLPRFEADRRSDAVAQRIRRDFEGGIRAGVAGTPAAFVDGRPTGDDVAGFLAQLT